VPKIVDHDQQRRLFADAAMRLIAREGFEAVTMRKVAAEAGLSYGSLFHYFDSKDDLLLFAIGRSTAEQGRRVSEFTSRKKGLQALQQLITDDTLVDSATRDDWMVWQAFIYRSSLQERFARMHAELIDGWVERIRSLLEEAQASGEVRQDLDPAAEAAALWVFSAGLGQQGLLHPSFMPPDRQKALIRNYVGKLRAA
jgi:AcrR family transcriptional regulator